MSQSGGSDWDEVVELVNANGTSSVVLVCEHASHEIPPEFNDLGLRPEQRLSHVAWDPGAMAVARRMSRVLDAALVAGGVSRLVYDCNRPPDAEGAMPARSEVVDVPGNVGLSAEARAQRVRRFYAPFQAALAAQIAQTSAPIIVTIHSFTPIYYGKKRSVEVGVLYDSDARLGQAMLQTAQDHTRANVMANAPYGAEDGVTHTLKEHAICAGHLNVMIEVRNDLIVSAEAQEKMGDMLAHWLVDAFAQTQAEGTVKCSA